jgi:hypothetical protein
MAVPWPMGMPGMVVTRLAVVVLADAGHNLSDVLGLIVAWIATVLARRAPSARFTYDGHEADVERDADGECLPEACGGMAVPWPMGMPGMPHRGLDRDGAGQARPERAVYLWDEGLVDPGGPFQRVRQDP